MLNSDMLNSLPSKFYSCFWDVDPKKMNLQKYDRFVIERLLEYGDFDALKWLKKNYGEEKIIASLKNTRNISIQTANFYSCLFNIPRKDLRCFQTSSCQKLSWFYRT